MLTETQDSIDLASWFEFRYARVAHAAAFLAIKAKGKLTGNELFKLLLIADRQYLARFGGGMFSGRHPDDGGGPDDMLDKQRMVQAMSRPSWSEVFAEAASGGVCKSVGLDDACLPLSKDPETLDELSRADVEVLTGVWQGVRHHHLPA